MSILPHPGVNTAIQYPHWYQRVAIPLQLQGPVFVPQQPIYAAIQPIYPAVVQQPIQLGEKSIPSSPSPSTSIPVYQRTPESYPDYPQRRKNQGADLSNLILLTKGGVKTRRAQTKGPKQKCNPLKEKSNFDVIVSLDQTEGEDDSIDLELDCSESKCICLKVKSSKQHNSFRFEKIIAVKENEVNQKKRLYSDVLANSSTTRIEENTFEKTYDNLERQAMEQYRTSEECLALRYQELERQALEQYISSENPGSEDFLNIDFAQSEFSQSGSNQSSLPEKHSFGAVCSNYASNSSIEGASTAKETAIAKSLTTLCRNIRQEQRDTSKGASGDESDHEAKEPLAQQILLMTSLMKPSFVNVIKTTDIKTLCKTFVPIFYQVPVTMQAGGGDEKISFEYPSSTLEKCLFHSEEQLTIGSLNLMSQSPTVSSQHEARSFSILDFETRSQNELISSSEIQLIPGANILEEEYHRTERYFTLQIDQYFKNLMKERCRGKKKVVDNLEAYLRNIIWTDFLDNSRISKPINDSNRDNSRLEIAMLQTWDEGKEAETNLAIEVNNVVEKNRSYETMTGNYYESVPDLLKKAYSILMKIKNDKSNEFEVRKKMFHDEEESILEKFLKD